MPTNDAHLPPGERALAEALQRERRRARRLLALSPLVVLALAAAGAMAVLWRGAVAEGRRLAEQTRAAERARVEAERQRDLAQLAADRLADQRARALAAQAEAERARADAETARRQVAALQYAGALQRAQQAWGAQEAHLARELLEGAPPERRGWEWRYLSRSPAPPPGTKD
jgi:colicin import membrane protein